MGMGSSDRPGTEVVRWYWAGDEDGGHQNKRCEKEKGKEKQKSEEKGQSKQSKRVGECGSSSN